MRPVACYLVSCFPGDCWCLDILGDRFVEMTEDTEHAQKTHFILVLLCVFIKHWGQSKSFYPL